MNDNTLYTTQETTKILRKYNVLAYSTKNTSNGRTYLEVNKGMSIFKLFILDLLFVIIYLIPSYVVNCLMYGFGALVDNSFKAVRQKRPKKRRKVIRPQYVNDEPEDYDEQEEVNDDVPEIEYYNEQDEYGPEEEKEHSEDENTEMKEINE